MSKNKNKNIVKKSLARLIAVQTLYQYDFYRQNHQDRDILDLLNDSPDNILDENEDKNNKSCRKQADLAFSEKILSSIILILPDIDKQIISCLKDPWTIDKLPDVMLSILRCAVFELKIIRNIPLKVIINEYVDIAGSFYDNKQVSFVNSILDTISKNIRLEENHVKENNK